MGLKMILIFCAPFSFLFIFSGFFFFCLFVFSEYGSLLFLKKEREEKQPLIVYLST